MNEIPESPAVAAQDPDVRAPSFQDWARFVSFQPQLYFRPQNLEELKGFLAAVLRGSFGNRHPRVLGSMHSCSDICVSDAVIDVGDLPRTMEFTPDHSAVTVSANWRFHDFLLALSQNGKSITATGGTDEQTLGGIISTNTAPATPHHTIYELVEWIEYITVDLETDVIVERRVERSDPDFPAVIGSLGAIGILTRLHMRVVDEVYFETIQKIVDIKDVLSDLDKTSQEYEFWRVDWIPDRDDGVLWAAKRIPSGDPNGDYSVDQSENVLLRLFNVLDKVEAAGPLLDNAMRVAYAVLVATYGETRVSGPLRNMLPVDRRAPLHVAMAEWSFDPADLNRLLGCCRDYFERSRWPNLPIEIELTKTDDYLMSPWNWPGLDYIIKFNFMYLTDVLSSEAEKDLISSHLKGLWDHLLQSGIPFKAHWGKLNFMDPSFVRSQFKFDEFEPFIRPVFLNEYLAERFFHVRE